MPYDLVTILIALLIALLILLVVGRIIGWALGIRDIRAAIEDNTTAVEEQTKTLDHLFQLQKYIAKQQGTPLPEEEETD